MTVTSARSVTASNGCGAGLSRIVHWTDFGQDSFSVLKILAFGALCLILVGAGAVPARAQNALTTATLGNQPGPVAVNYRTNQVFVGNTADGTVSVVDGATGAILATVSLGLPAYSPTHIAVDEATNQIYVAAAGCGCIVDIDGNGKKYPATTISIGSGGAGIDVNQATNMIYVANLADQTLSVIDGSTNLQVPGSPFAIGASPNEVVVNPVADLVFISAGSGASAELYVWNGASNATVGDVTVPNISDFAVNATTDKAFAIDATDGRLYVVDGATAAQVGLPVPVPSDAQSHVVVNPATNLVYVNDASLNSVAVISGANYSVLSSISVAGGPDSLAVNPTANKIYAANSTGTNLAVIDGTTNAVVYVPATGTPPGTLAGTPVGVAANPITDKIYVVSQAPSPNTGVLTVVDGSTYTTSSALTGEIAPGPVATNPVTNQIYVNNFVTATAEVFSGSPLSVLADLSVGGVPDSIAINLLTNKAYAANSGSNEVTVVDGTANTATNLPIDEGYSVDVNTVTDMVYIPNYNDGTVSVMDGRNNAVVATIPVPSPTQATVDTVNNQIYVASNPDTGGVLYDLDGNNSYAPTVVPLAGAVSACAGPIADLAVNPIANQVFVLDALDGVVCMVDPGNGNAVTAATIAPGNSSIPAHLAVNLATNQVYVTNPTNNTVTPLDGYSLTVGTPVPVNGQPYDVAVNSATNRVYVTLDPGLGPSGVAVIDGATNTLVNVPVGSTPSDVAVNAVTQTAYVTDRGLNSLIAIQEQQIQALGLATSISTLPGNQVTNFNPAFTFTTSPAAAEVYYQLDSLAGPWMSTSGSAGTFTTPGIKPVSQGTHVIYFFATDGEAPSSGGGVGNIGSYIFVAGSPVAPAFTSPDSATFSTGVNNSFVFTVSGFPTTPIFTYTSLPALPSGLTFTDNGNGSATLSGNPSTTGTVTLTVTASNGVGGGATQVFSLTINQAPAFTSANTTTFAVNTSGSFTVMANGVPAAITFSLQAATPPLPSSITFNASTGVLSGTPAAGSGGVYYLTFGATNGVAPDATQSFTLNVNQSPTITSTSINPFVVGVPGTFQVQTGGFPVPTVNLTSSVPPLPAGVTYNSSNGVLSGTPAPGTGGSYTLTFDASNGIAPDATQILTLSVEVPPVFTSAQSATFVVGTPGSFQVKVTGLPTPTLELSTASPSMPGGITFNSSTGVLSGTATQYGVYVLTFEASNGVLHAVSQTFTLTIDQAPVFTGPTSAYFAVGSNNSFRVVATGYPQPALTYSALPSGLTFNASTQLLSGIATTKGTYPVTFTATNSLGSVNQVITVNVVAAFKTPAFTSASSTTFSLGVPGSFTVVTNDGPPPPVITESGVLPTGVTFTDNGNGTATLAGTTSTTGSFAMKFTATNQVGAGTQNFTLTVAKVATSISVTTSSSSVLLSQPVTFTATVKSAVGAPPDTEVVGFYSGSSSCTSLTSIGTGTLTSGVATLTTSTLPGGTLHICAKYGGDPTFAASNSPAITQTVIAPATTTTVASSLNPSTYGQSVTLTATVTGTGSHNPTGTVTFQSNSSTLATVSLKGPIATYTTSALPAGALSTFATYNGDANNAASSSAVVLQTVNQATTSLTLTVSPSSSTLGSSVKFTATVTSSSGAKPTGSVKFTFGSTTLGTANLSSGVATLSTKTLPHGTDSVTASYAGTANFGSSLNSVNETVN